MKKAIITIIIIIVLVATLVLIGFNCAMDNARISEGIITEVNGEVITVETADGNLWEFEGEGYTEGQQVEVLFSDNGSKDCLKDDIIQNVRGL